MKDNLINDLLKLMLIAVSIILVCIGVIFVSDKMSAKETSITTVYKSTRDVPSKSLSTSIKMGEVSVLEYVEEISTTNSTDSLKDGFVKVVDFLFYGEKINNFTFSELTDEIKLKVLKVVYAIDSKIDKLFPGYKEKIKSVASRIYTKIKERLTELYIKVTNAICNSKPTVCENAKLDFKDMKEKFGITYEYLKSLFQKGKDKLNTWYLEFKDN